MTSNEIAGIVVLFLLGSGGGASWLILEAIKLRDKVQLHEDKLIKFEKDCEKCREEVQLQLNNGVGEFKKLNKDINDTQYDLLETMKKIAEDNGQYRVNVIEKFVTENTFKDRVIATMMSFCPNCGKKS